MMDSSATLLSPVAPWELPPQTGAEAAGLADLRAMLAELSDASLERILFDSAGKPEEEGVGAAPKTTSSSPSVVAEARKAGELDALLQRHLEDVINVERLAWSGDGGDGSTFRGKPPSPASVRVVASSAGGEEAASTTTPSSGVVAPATSPRSSIARWWANRKTLIGRKGRKAAAKEAAAAVKEAAATETTSSSAVAIIFAREAAVALSSSDAGVAGAAAWAVTRWLSLHPAHWRALLDAGCVAPLVELLMNNASAALSSAAANAAASANAAVSPASSAAAATSTTSNINNSLNDDAPAAACAALALRAIASSGPDAQAAAAAAGAVGAAVDALEAVEDDGLWTGLAAVEEEEEEEEEQEKEGEGEQRETKSNDNNENENDDASCSSPRSPSSFPSPPVLCSKKKKKTSSSSPSNPLLAHRRAQQEALASLIGALTAGNEAVALAATAAGCLPRLLALLSPSRNYSPALAACALFSLQPLVQVPGVRARLLLLDEGGRSSSAGNTNNGSNSNNNEERNPVALVTGSLRRLTGVSGATRAAAMLLLSLLTETEREKEDHDGGGEQHQQKRCTGAPARERERERSVFLRWMAEADTPGELVRVLQPWALAAAEEEAGSSSKNSSAPSTPLSSKQEGTTQPRQLSAATVAAVCSALAAISRSGDRRCAALLFTASCDGPAVLRGVVRRASTAPSAARSARAALEALGEASEEDDEDDFDGEGEEEKLTEEELAKMAEARERAATYFL